MVNQRQNRLPEKVAELLARDSPSFHVEDLGAMERHSLGVTADYGVVEVFFDSPVVLAFAQFVPDFGSAYFDLLGA
jgi:hypothetical protein